MSEPSELGQLWAIVRRYYGGRFAVTATILLAIVVGLANVICPWLLGDAIDALVAMHANGGGSLRRPSEDVVVIGFVIGAQFVAHYAMARIINALIYRGTTSLRLDLASAIEGDSIGDPGRMRLGDLLARFMTDIQQLQDALLDLLAELPFDIFTIIGLSIAMVVMSPRLGVIVLSFLLAMVAVSILLGRRGWAEQVAVQEQHGDIGARISEVAAAAKTIAVMGGSAGERRELERRTAELERSLVVGGRTRALAAPFFGLSEYLGLLVVLGVGGWFLLRGDLTVGSLVCMLAYMEMASEPISHCGRILPRLQKAAASAVRIRALIDRPQRSIGFEEIPHAVGHVKFDQVSLIYPQAQRPALRSISTTIEPGQLVAVIGRNGAGKSTLLDLLMRHKIPTAGAIAIDGVPLAQISSEAHARIVGVVPQEVILLNRSVADNISLGLNDPSTVASAAAAAGLDEVTQSLRHGLDTPIGERGALLSGGQRQRIAIARLLARDPRIVILDEPTSALDAVTEAAVIPALRRLCRGRAGVLVSHRKALLELADRVLLLDQGEQVADAAPAEVWERFPQWRDLFPAAWAVGSRHAVPS
jgi:ABC-type multidrug transport system fused ATPase/permease subunit